MQAILLTGSNQGNRVQHMMQASKLISGAMKVQLASPLYETEPWGFQHPDQFLNQALLIDTSLIPAVLLKTLLSIEQQMGRKRTGSGYSARNIDIDILFYGQEIIQTPQLIVPHPRLHLRRFALMPAARICPTWNHPVLNQTLTQLLDRCNDKLKVTLFRENEKNNAL
jgi:2-amino-4-hydroxy-6-hydroxymethyldihydropteridine diphosphokinase